MRIKLSIIILFVIFAIPISTGTVFADLFINEFSSASSNDDWIEIFNSSSDDIDLSAFRIRDDTESNKLDLDGTLSAGGFKVFSWSNKLNNSGDTIKLVLKSDESIIKNQVAYGDKGSDVIAPIGIQSAGRISNGSNQWIIFANSSKETGNAESSPAPTPTSTPNPIPTKTPTPTKAPTPTRVPTPTKTPIKTASGSIYHNTTTTSPTVKPNSINPATKSPKKSVSISAVPTSILGMKTKSVSKNELKNANKKLLIDSANKNNSTNGLIFAIAGLLAISCGILVFFIRKKNKMA
ncbi:MAG TPA: lamin tail domain-containing protein [Candidatus Limnocylindrales bacterium]|nr:lamin tail domain-containing protein [Candidatus Limnocylindrales bacterium]